MQVQVSILRLVCYVFAVTFIDTVYGLILKFNSKVNGGMCVNQGKTI